MSMIIHPCEWAHQKGCELKLSCPERVTLWQLARRAATKGYCWPSVPLLMGDTGLARQTILTVVHRLADLGLIRIEKVGQKHHYHILDRSKLRPDQSPKPVQNKTADRSTFGPSTGLKTSSDRSKSDTQTGLKSLPDLIKEPEKNQKGGADAPKQAKVFNHSSVGSKKAAAPPTPPREPIATPQPAEVAQPEDREPTPAEIQASRQRQLDDLAAMPPGVANAIRNLANRFEAGYHGPGRWPERTREVQAAAVAPPTVRPAHLAGEALAAARALARLRVTA